MHDAIPGSAKDDFDRLRMLFLRANNLDLSTRFSLRCVERRPGVGWTLSFEASGCKDERSGFAVTEIVAALVRELTRRILLRWRSDGGVLQLCGTDPTPHDPLEPEVVEAVVIGRPRQFGE